MRNLRTFLVGAALAFTCTTPVLAQEAEKPEGQEWSFYGPFGTFERASLQRGFQVYKEVCAACHSMDLLSYHSLSALGYGEAEVKAIANSVIVADEPNDAGEVLDRPGRASDRFKNPYPNEKAARNANNGAFPKDLSLIVKGRPYGPDYIYALLTGFVAAPADVKLPPNMHYNAAFPGHQISMPPPLKDDKVKYDDGTKATIAQEAHDVTTFLAWAADPHLEDRHRIGARVVLFLVVLSGVMYGVKRKVWAGVKH